ncbi:hypothetical protein V491_00765, partial [Pseudogymnoascus sp. VKM F-3775]
MVQSAGSSSTIALSSGVVGDIITSAERGTYIAFSSLAGIFGPMIAPVLGGAIAQARRELVVDKDKQEEIRRRYRIGFPNPLATLKVVGDLSTAIILICTGVGIGCFYAISTGAATAFSKHYNFNPLQVSLMFIPIGAGSVLSAFTSGALIDWNYRRHARRLGITVVKNRRQDLREFPIETARLQVGFPMLFLAGAAVASYGWTVRAGAPLAAPIVLNVLLVDMWPGKAAVATSANNL